MSRWEWVGTVATEWRGFVIPTVLAAARNRSEVTVVSGRALDQPVSPADLADGTYTLAWDREVQVARLGVPVAEDAPDQGPSHEELAAKALEFNRALGVPVAWLPDHHFRADGAPATGWSNRVQHVRLREDLHEGRLHRVRGDWLCRPTRRGHDELFGVDDREAERGTDASALLAFSPVTCAACLRVCRRWANSAKKDG